MSKPLILLEKYRSILWSSLAVEVVVFIVSLTDSIVAGNLIGINAFSAISLFSPFLFVSSFIAAVVNTGTLVSYTREVGRFDQKRAHEFFSQGLIMAVAAGTLITSIVLMIKPLYLASVPVSPAMKTYLSRYYSIAAFYLLVFPANCVLNNIIVADGGERHAAIANIACTIGNIAFSILLAKPFGVTGIAAATLASDVIFLVILCMWFGKRQNTVSFTWHWSNSDMIDMIKRGIVRASKFISTSLMLWLINMYVLRNFGTATFQAWTVDQNILGLSTVFLGIAMTLQPILGTLIGEKNTKAIRVLVRSLSFDLAIISIACTLLIWCFTPAVLRIFGVTSGAVLDAGIPALRITSLTLVFGAQLVLLFVYYFLQDRKMLALAVDLMMDLICPVALVFLLGAVRHGDPSAIWTGLALSNVAAALISAGIILTNRNGRDFPLLLPAGSDERIHIFSFDISPENTSNMAETAGKLIKEARFSKRLQSLVSLCIEDMLNLIAEHNVGTSKPVMAECTLIIEDKAIELILRDNGVRFDILKENMQDYSFLKYMVDRIITIIDYKAYIATTGYNRYELRFEEAGSSAQE